MSPGVSRRIHKGWSSSVLNAEHGLPTSCRLPCGWMGVGERNEVVVVKGVMMPTLLLQHLPVMAELNEIPMCGFRDAQGRMQKLMALKKLSCFALKVVLFFFLPL